MACSRKLEEEKERTKGKGVKSQTGSGKLGQQWRNWRRRGWTTGERRGKIKRRRGGCGEVPRPATGSAVRMINGN